MTKRPNRLPFQLSAPAMIFGHDIVENADMLSAMVDNVEIVLFHTPTQNNFLSRRDIIALSDITRQTGVGYTVHLPTSLEIAALDSEKRAESIRRTVELIKKCEELNPRHFILHVPYSPLTLVYKPGEYFKQIEYTAWKNWLERSTNSLVDVKEAVGKTNGLLIENINYSVYHLEPLVRYELCDICLDVGHLLLGQEKVALEIARYKDVIKEIHIHGVKGHMDHHSLDALPQERLSKWLKQLTGMGFSGILNLEVFSPSDLKSSIDLIDRIVSC